MELLDNISNEQEIKKKNKLRTNRKKKGATKLIVTPSNTPS